MRVKVWFISVLAIALMWGLAVADSSMASAQNDEKNVQKEREEKLREVCHVLWNWAETHDDVLPESFEQAGFEDQNLKKWAIENIEYLAAGKAFSDFRNPNDEVIAYDKGLFEIQESILLLYANGYVKHCPRKSIPRRYSLRPKNPFLQGHVYDVHGKPVAGATVQIRQKREPGMRGIAAPDVTTDDKGYFWYDSIDWPYKLGALAKTTKNNGRDEYTLYIGERRYYEGPKTVDIRFDSGFPKGDRTLCGRVLGPDQKPLTDFTVWIRNFPDWQALPPKKMRQYVLQKRFTNDRGEYIIEDLPAGSHSVSIHPPTKESGYFRYQAQTVDLNDKKMNRVDFTKINTQSPELRLK